MSVTEEGHQMNEKLVRVEYNYFVVPLLVFLRGLGIIGAKSSVIE